MLDYFDAFQIGLTATPDNRTLGYFNKNLVSEYTPSTPPGLGKMYQIFSTTECTECTDLGL